MIICVNIALVLQVFISSSSLKDSGLAPETYSVVKGLRINMIVCIILNMLELMSRIRIFEYFSYFVRQLIEIMVDAMPLGAMLAMIVLTQTILFWILD